MKKKLSKKELLEKLDTFRKKIKYYHDTLEISLEELTTTQSSTTPDQIKKTTSHLRQDLRKIWGSLEKYYTNLGIQLAFAAEEVNQQKIDIFYHSFSENFFHDTTIIGTLNHALQLTDIALGKCEVMHDKEIAKLEYRSFYKKNFSKIQIIFYLLCFSAGIAIAQYVSLEEIRHITTYLL